MLGITVQLLISWLLVWLFEKQDLRVLGLVPTKNRVFDLFIFFMITAVCCSTGFLLKMYFGGLRWELNPKLTFNLIAEGLWWHTRSVLYEELIFRGVILYILLKRIGSTKAVIVSAIAFGIYHWFSFNILGNWMQMAFVFIMAGTMGLLLAFGYVKTLSLYVPIGIHLGWNFTQGFVFSDGPIGVGILKQVGNEQFRTGSYLVFYTVLLLPMILMLLINFYLLRKKKPVHLPRSKRLPNTVVNEG